MADERSHPAERGTRQFDIEAGVAHSARVHNYLAGGNANFRPDRELAHYLSDAVPGGLDATRATVQALADFMLRSVRYLTDQMGVRQFLSIGTFVPTADDLHEVAQAAVPDARVVYVGSDPVVLAHAHALRAKSPTGATAYVHGTLRDPAKILHEADVILDLDQPVAVLLLSTLSFVPDERDPHGMVAELLEGVPSGSHLVLAHTTNDIPAEGMAEAAERLAEVLRDAYVVRTHAEVSRFFDGLELVGSGLVQADLWRSDGAAPPDGHQLIPIYGGVGRKP